VKHRIPSSFSSATAKIIKGLGIEQTAEVAVRSPSLVYKWADEDFEHYPTLKQALEMDLAFVRQGKGPPPLLSAYITLLRHGLDGSREQAIEVLPEALKLVNLACEVLQEIAAQKARSEADDVHPATTKTCGICVTLRKVGEVESALSWKMTDDPSNTICPLRRTEGAGIHCLLYGPKNKTTPGT